MTHTITASISEIHIDINLTGAPDLDGVIPDRAVIEYQPDWPTNAAYITVRGPRRLTSGKTGKPTSIGFPVGDLEDGSDTRIDCPPWLAGLVEAHRPGSCK